MLFYMCKYRRGLESRMCTKFKNIGYVFGRMNRIWASSCGTRVLYMSALFEYYVIFFKEKLLLKKAFIHSTNIYWMLTI